MTPERREELLSKIEKAFPRTAAILRDMPRARVRASADRVVSIERSSLRKGDREEQRNIAPTGQSRGFSFSVPRLDPAERTVAELVLQGKMSCEIAEILGWPLATVKAHLRRIRAKFPYVVAPDKQGEAGRPRGSP